MKIIFISEFFSQVSGERMNYLSDVVKRAIRYKLALCKFRLEINSIINLTLLGLHGQVLVAVGDTRVASVSCQKLPPCPAESMPGGSRMDLLPAKAGPIMNGGNTSVITYLRKKRKKRYCADVIAAKEE